LLSSFSNVLLYVTFKINQKEIAKNICILKKVKNNTCQGHCALKLELKKNAENEKRSGSILKEKAEVLYIFSITKLCISNIFEIVARKQVTLLRLQKPTAVSLAIFHPPLYNYIS
jgi:hypothetical protein